jgi:hypothetical protein
MMIPSLLLAGALFAQETPPSQPQPLATPSTQPEKAASGVEIKDDTPWILRWMIRPLKKKKGMLVRLPIMDTDPNRGTTIGVMPIWIIQEGEGNNERITHIHAPSITYNKTFKAIPTYRYYWYPTDTSALLARAATSTQEERELMISFDDEKFLGNEMVFSGKAQFNVDGAQRFFGYGPSSPKRNEANYVSNYHYFNVSAGVPVPFVDEPRFKIFASHQYTAQRLLNGRTPNLMNITERFPQFVAHHRHQVTEIGTWLAFDSRDHSVTTGQGTYARLYSFHSVRDFMSEYDYNRFGLDVRHFWPFEEDHVLAGQLKFEQMTGGLQAPSNDIAPFWLHPKLGGKSSLRAYGEGRYVDRGMFSLNFEHRISLYKIPLAGVTTVFEVAPFIGMGTVFDAPGKAQAKWVRPVFGGAIRAVAKPQVVGSLDFGYGQEGLATFIDINYSF